MDGGREIPVPDWAGEGGSRQGCGFFRLVSVVARGLVARNFAASSVFPSIDRGDAGAMG